MDFGGLVTVNFWILAVFDGPNADWILDSGQCWRIGGRWILDSGRF